MPAAEEVVAPAPLKPLDVEAPARNASAAHRRVPRWASVAAWVLCPTLAGFVVGLALPASGGGGEPDGWARVSAAIGWSYFCAWSVSFYPQVVRNFSRRSVVGLSADFQMLNFAGFACYLAYNAALYWNPVVQSEYREAHDGHSSAVRLNDVVFALHALVLTTLTLLQIAFFYDYPALRGSDKVLRIAVVAALVTLAVGSAGFGTTIALSSQRAVSWLDYLMLLSEVKVVISLLKYMPQVWLNFRRKSTEGWAIENVLLDFTGGLLSVVQLVMDAGLSNDWSAISGNPAKFLLGNISMLFDVVFMVQHYGLYRTKPVAATVAPHDEKV